VSRLRRPRPVPAVPDACLEVGDRRLPVALKVSAAARRLTLRLDPLRDRVVVTRPKGVPAREALAFARAQTAWVATRLDALAPRVPFAPGQEIPVLGTPHRIEAAPGTRRGVWMADGRIHVSGAPEFTARRVRDFLVKTARHELTARSHDLAARLGRRPARVAVRDTRSRWGSCTSTGHLSFSWRLILAPVPVLQYVVAHEVAHLVELNHSPRFWAVVRDLVGETRAERDWLKTHGSRLHRFG